MGFWDIAKTVTSSTASYIGSLRYGTPAMQPVSIETIHSTPFDYNNPAHLQLLREQSANLNKAVHDLRAIDQTLVYSLGAVIACSVLSFLPLSLPVCIIGAAVASNRFTIKGDYIHAYSQAHQDAVRVYEWVMGNHTGNKAGRLAVPVIQDYILALGPWVEPSTLCTWNDSDLTALPDNFKGQLHAFKAGMHTKSIPYYLYGERYMLSLVSETISAQVASKATWLVDNALSLMPRQP